MHPPTKSLKPEPATNPPAEVEQNIASHAVVAAQPVIKVNAGTWSIECNVAVKHCVERLSLEKETVLFGVYAEFVGEIHDDVSASWLIATARIKAHAWHRASVGKSPLGDGVSH